MAKIYTAQEANETGIVEISGKVFKTDEYVGVGEKGENPKAFIPVITMSSDYRYMQSCLKSRLEHPEWYEKDEDVDLSIEKIKKWLAQHTEG